MKRFLAAFLTLAILLTGLTLTASAAETGWKKDGEVWTYTKADGKLATDEWVQVGGKWYYFNGTVMAEDTIEKINDKWYGFDKSGAMAANGWYSTERTGERDDGATITGKIWYYAEADGAFARGWKKIGKVWYYFSEEEDWAPYMYEGDRAEINDKLYAFKQSGEMIVGWGQPWVGSPWNSEPDTSWVYANADGSLVKEAWKKIDGKWYYFGKYGNMLRDTWYKIVGGKIVSDDEEGAPIYIFNKSGAMVENGWYKAQYMSDNWDGIWMYAGKDGVGATGWLKDGGKWYYLSKNYGEMYSDCTADMSDGKTYAFKKNGEMVTGWYQFEGDDTWYYFNDSGAKVEKEWIKGKDGKSWYYVKEGGAMAKDETLTIDGKEYKFDKDGVWVEK